MDEKLKPTLEKIVQLTRQNLEFDLELRKALEITPSASSVSISDEKLDQIYEYCIEKIIRKQATEFYKGFPIESITPELIEDYVKMEFFRRKDDFGNFCLALYQQIENITNRLCETRTISDIAESMWAYPAYVKDGIIGDRPESEYCIAKLVFTNAINKRTEQPYYVEKSRVALQSQYAMDKIKSIVYFIGYKAALTYSDYKSYVEFTLLMQDIYQCRNMNHRGNTLNEWERTVLDRIMPIKSLCYFKFLGGLSQYVEFVKSGYRAIEEIETYAKSLQEKKINLIKLAGPKILGKIDLKDDGKKRFN